ILGGMIHVRDAARDGIEHLEGTDKLSRSENLDFKAAAGVRRDRAAKSFSAAAKTGKAFRPARHHLELPGTLCDGRSRKSGRYAGNNAGPGQKAASIHGTFPRVFSCFWETTSELPGHRKFSQIRRRLATSGGKKTHSGSGRPHRS